MQASSGKKCKYREISMADWTVTRRLVFCEVIKYTVLYIPINDVFY